MCSSKAATQTCDPATAVACSHLHMEAAYPFLLVVDLLVLKVRTTSPYLQKEGQVVLTVSQALGAISLLSTQHRVATACHRPAVTARSACWPKAIHLAIRSVAALCCFRVAVTSSHPNCLYTDWRCCGQDRTRADHGQERTRAACCPPPDRSKLLRMHMAVTVSVLLACWHGQLGLGTACWSVMPRMRYVALWTGCMWL